MASLYRKAHTCHLLTMTWYHRVHIEWQLPLFGVHAIMMEKSAQPGENGGCTPTPFHSIYNQVQSFSVRSSWEGRCTPPSSTITLYMYYVHTWYSRATHVLRHPLYLRSCTLQKKQKWRDQGESHRDVVYLGWSKAPSYMSPNKKGGGWGVAGSQLAMATISKRSETKLRY